MESNNQATVKKVSFASVLDPSNIKADRKKTKSNTTKEIQEINLNIGNLSIISEENHKKEEKKSSKKNLPDYSNPSKTYPKSTKNLVYIPGAENKNSKIGWMRKSTKTNKHTNKLTKLDDEFLEKCNLYKTPLEKINSSSTQITITYVISVEFMN